MRAHQSVLCMCLIRYVLIAHSSTCTHLWQSPCPCPDLPAQSWQNSSSSCDHLTLSTPERGIKKGTGNKQVKMQHQLMREHTGVTYISCAKLSIHLHYICPIHQLYMHNIPLSIYRIPMPLPPGIGLMCLATGLLSPVSASSATRKLAVSKTRKSAGS